MSLVSSIELHFVSLPLPAPFAPAWVPGALRLTTTFYLVRIRTDDGVEGFSAFPAVARERAGIGDALVSLFMGRDATDIDRVQEMLRIPAYGGIRNFWIEPAFWDIRGKLAGKPVYRLLGGGPDRLRLYASCGEVKEPGARIEEALARHEEGFRMIKLRVHDFDEAVDIAHVQQVAHALEGKMRVAVDCNQGFRQFAGAQGPVWDVARAKRFVDACHEAGLAWVEEPLFMEWHGQQAELAEYSRVPVAGGEIHTAGLTELSEMIERRCYDIFQPDAIWTGGIAQTIEVARRARQAGLAFTSHSWSNAIGFAVNMHVMAASGFAEEIEFEYPVSPPGWPADAGAQILKQPWTQADGMLAMPALPGLGFEIDEAVLQRHGRCFFRANRASVHWMPEALADVPRAPA